jgi:hypothetical protein
MLGIGGAQKSFLNVAELLRTSYDIRLFSFSADETETKPDGFSVEYVDRGSSHSRKVLRWVEMTRVYRALLRSAQPVASISFLEGANYINAVASFGVVPSLIRCLVPWFDGAFFSPEWRDAL